MTTQPKLPDPVLPNVIERAYIQDSPAGLWPDNQDSNFGIHRKIFCDRLFDAVSQLNTIFNELFPTTSVEYIQQWEEELGVSVAPPNRSLAQRRAAIIARSKRGLFTRAGRIDIIEGFIIPVLGGTPPAFTTSGISLSGGIPLHTGINGDPKSFYSITEDITNFHYHIQIDTRLAVDISALTRELLRYTPAGISFDISSGQATSFKTGGAKTSPNPGATKRVTYAKTGGGKAGSVAGSIVPGFGVGLYGTNLYGGTAPRVSTLARMGLSSVTAPTSSRPVTLRVRARKANVADSGILTVYLYQGVTLIEQVIIQLTDTFTTYEHPLLNQANITSWSTLELRLQTASLINSRTLTTQVSFVELQV